jgi:hypothetical protein
LPKHVPTKALVALHGTSVTANPAKVKLLPAVIRDGLRVAFSDSLHVVFISAVPFALLAFALSWFLREVPLRQTTGRQQASAGGPGEQSVPAEHVAAMNPGS